MSTRGKMSFRRARNFENEEIRREAAKMRIRSFVQRTTTILRFYKFAGYVFVIVAVFVHFYRLHSIVDRCKSNRQLVEKYFLRRHWNTAFLQVFYNSSRRARASIRRRRKTVEIKFY